MVKLTLILYFSLEIIAQKLTPEQREEQRIRNAAERKKNRQKNKKASKNKNTTKISTTKTTTTTTTTTTTSTEEPTTTTGFTTTLSTSTTWTPRSWLTTTTTRKTSIATRPRITGNAERVIDRTKTMCLSCNGRKLLECLQNGKTQECPKDSFCSLTMRTQNGEPIQYEMSCKQSTACLTNKKSNGWGIKGSCNFSKGSAATCRQCCIGPDCINYFQEFQDQDFYRVKWNWNAPLLDKPYDTFDFI